MKIEYIGVIEVSEGALTIIKKGNSLIAGTMCNTGMVEHYSQDYDDYFSMNENLQLFIEWMEREIRRNK